MPLILRIAVPTPLYRLFDYLPPEAATDDIWQAGQRFEVPFGRGRKIGVLMELAETAAVPVERLKPALSLLDPAPVLSPADLKLLVWASRYYHHPIGEAVAAAVAVLARGGQPASTRIARRLCATGPEPAAAARAAPRQGLLLELLRSEPAGLSPRALGQLDWDYRPAASALVRKGLAEWKEALPAAEPEPGPAEPAPELNRHQAAALAAILESGPAYRAFLLDGVTGSGKTEVYLRAAEAALEQGRQVVILLPEISLTPQLEARFRARLRYPLVVYHSGLGDGERRRAWQAMQRGAAAILLGTRSAVFTPLAAPGLIVLDEEHDPSFKQQDGFRYSARDVAVMRARLAGIPIVLGSATPSLESLRNAARGRYRHLSLPERAGAAGAPAFRLLDIRAQPLREGISPRLAGAIAETLGRGEQALLFVNRRGFAPVLTCHACGWVAGCRHCDAHLVIHAGDGRLRCHHCGHRQALPPRCPACGEAGLQPLGLGTERVEAALAELFPAFRLARIDRDSVRSRERLRTLLDDARAGRIDLLIGTQMLAKGHHFPGVTLVGIIDVDAGLYSTDFRAAERTAQTIVQVAGRAGRAERPGSVLLQTRHPDHPLLRALVQDGYSAFAESALAERRAAHLPPFSHQALLRAEAAAEEPPQRFLAAAAARLRQPAAPALTVLGPAPAPLARRAGRYRWQLLLQAEQRSELHGALDRLRDEIPALDAVRKVRWSIDVDPADLF